MIPVPFVFDLETGKGKSTQANDVSLHNMIMSYSRSAKRTILEDFPGLKLFSTGLGADRGSHVMKEQLYALQGRWLCRVKESGAIDQLGEIPGSNRAVFSNDGTNLYIVVENKIYIYDGSSISQVSQSVISNPRWILYINSQFIIGGDGALFAVSDPADGETYGALDVASAEVQPDDLTVGYDFNQLIYLAGPRSIETFINTGVGNPPVARQDNSLMNIGIIGLHAICHTTNYLYWLGRDKMLYQCVGSSARTVSTNEIAHEVGELSDASAVVMSSLVIDGSQFVMLSFGSRTFLYNETLDRWSTLGSGADDQYSKWLGSYTLECYGKTFCSDYISGNVYELDSDTYTDNGASRLRVVGLPSADSTMIRSPNRQICVSNISLNMEVGTALLTGQGSNPVIMYEYSPDGGKTYQGQRFCSIGEAGNYRKSINLYDFCTGYQVKCKIQFTDPCYFSVFDGTLFIKDAGY